MASATATNSAASDRKVAVVTRFAPSPTGFLHIGGARTALFNWLFARHHGGTYLLRIEDTDRARSTEPAIAAIFDGLSWLGLQGDGEPVFQFARSPRHAQVAHQLLDTGHAYRCYLAQDELAARRLVAQAERRPLRIDSEWRDADPATFPADTPYVIRIKAPRDGETVIDDLVQGAITVNNREIDDFVILRSDGTPTYMLAVVVDDHDMGVTHVIRGDDHINNAFRQLVVIRAMDAIECAAGTGAWPDPLYAHIPLIHGTDGAKLSKRHGALGVDAYRDELGLLPEAMINYLLRLGWGHGDDEIISRDQAVEWFDIADVNKGAARFDLKKLLNINGHYLRSDATARTNQCGADRAADACDAGAESTRGRSQRIERQRAVSVCPPPDRARCQGCGAADQRRAGTAGANRHPARSLRRVDTRSSRNGDQGAGRTAWARSWQTRTAHARSIDRHDHVTGPLRRAGAAWTRRGAGPIAGSTCMRINGLSIPGVYPEPGPVAKPRPAKITQED